MSFNLNFKNGTVRVPTQKTNCLCFGSRHRIYEELYWILFLKMSVIDLQKACDTFNHIILLQTTLPWLTKKGNKNFRRKSPESGVTRLTRLPPLFCEKGSAFLAYQKFHISLEKNFKIAESNWDDKLSIFFQSSHQ